MAWTVEFERSAERELSRLSTEARNRILFFLYERVSVRDDPRSIGEALKGSRLGELWKYRIGEYRVIARIDDRAISILVVRVGNRRDVYR